MVVGEEAGIISLNKLATFIFTPKILHTIDCSIVLACKPWKKVNAWISELHFATR